MKSDTSRVLIVDDSRAVRQLLKLVIGKHLQVKITEAEDGVDAIEKISTDGFDLVITDINMPRMDGLALVRELRHGMGKKIPIIIITTMGKEADRDAGLDLGANSYITKPINGTQLVRTVSSLIN